MRDNIGYEVRRYETDMEDEQDSPATMWAIAIGTPLFLIACIFGAKWMLL